jgi:hypothetical protein
MLQGAPVALPTPAPPPASSAAPPPAAPLEADPVRLRVTLPERIELASIFEASVTIGIQNDGDRAVQSLFVPATVGFLVITPSGVTVRCGANTALNPIAELLGTVGPHGRTAVTVQLGATCPSGTFDAAGLYVVKPRLDTSHLGQGAPRARLFRGEVLGAPSLLRLHTGPVLRALPKVDPAP